MIQTLQTLCAFLLKAAINIPSSAIVCCTNGVIAINLALAACRQSTIAECKAQLAILTGNRQLWDDALAWWHKVLDAYIKPCGECGETQRDLFHSQFGLGGLIQLAEIAWQQGVDLYSYKNSKLFTAMVGCAGNSRGMLQLRGMLTASTPLLCAL